MAYSPDCTQNPYAAGCSTQLGIVGIGGAGIAIFDAGFTFYVLNAFIVIITLLIVFASGWHVGFPKNFFVWEPNAIKFWWFVIAIFLLFFTVISLIIKLIAYSKNDDKLNNDSHLMILITSVIAYFVMIVIGIIAGTRQQKSTSVSSSSQ